jgi:hypothetical protein
MNDQAILERVLARRAAAQNIPAQEWIPTHLRVGAAEITNEQEIADEIAKILAPTSEVTKLPEVHDPAGDTLPFHVASGKATQVLGSVAIDPSRMPDADDPTLTDSKSRTLRVEHQVARRRERDAGVAEIEPEITKLIQASKLGKLAHKWDASIHVTVRVSR